jgi:purine-binding chemotaxis protein CheW
MHRFNRPGTPRAPAGKVRQYLTFTLDEEVYGLDILKVQEIRGYGAVTPLPNAPAHLEGVMNLRGVIIPVVSLRRQFGLAEVGPNRFNVIIVLSVGARAVGVVVDAVSGVVGLATDNIQPPPDFGEPREARSISGLVNVEARVILLLDVDGALGRAAGLASEAVGLECSPGEASSDEERPVKTTASCPPR